MYFGNLSAGPADVARLVVAEYGILFSDDWFIAPLTVDVGTLNRVTAMEVIDVFGDSTAIAATAVNDNDIYGDARPFRYFELEGDADAARLGPWLFVPPALADRQNGKAVERVTLVRDEQANLGWAIEQVIELPTGEPLRRRQQWRRPGRPARDAGPADTDRDGAVPWRYRLQTPVPPWWIPLSPEQTGNGAEVRLRRSRLQSWDQLDQALIGAKGRLVGMARALRIFEEEVPEGGVQVTRRWQRARGYDGRAVVWMARMKRPGRGDRASNLSSTSLNDADRRYRLTLSPSCPVRELCIHYYRTSVRSTKGRSAVRTNEPGRVRLGSPVVSGSRTVTTRVFLCCHLASGSSCHLAITFTAQTVRRANSGMPVWGSSNDTAAARRTKRSAKQFSRSRRGSRAHRFHRRRWAEYRPREPPEPPQLDTCQSLSRRRPRS